MSWKWNLARNRVLFFVDGKFSSTFVTTTRPHYSGGIWKRRFHSENALPWQSWKTTTHASLGTQSAGKSRLKQQIPNVKSITERWRYFVDLLHDFESFYLSKRFIYLRGITFNGPYRWNFRKARNFVYFIDPLLCIVASRAAFSRHGLLTSR